MDFYERWLTKAGIRRVSLARNPAGVIDLQPELKLPDECWPQILREPHKEFCFSSYCVRANNEGRTLETRQLSIFRIMYHIGDIGELSADARPMRRSSIGRASADARPMSVERRSSVGRASADARRASHARRPTAHRCHLYDTWSYFSRDAPSPCSISSWQPNANFYQPHTDLDVNTVNSL